MNITYFLNYLGHGDFDSAYDWMNKTDNGIELADEALCAQAARSFNFSHYAFVYFVRSKKEDHETYFLSYGVLFMLPFIPGAYESLAYFARRQMLFFPNGNEQGETLLFLNEHPEQYVQDDEAASVAHKILERNPANKKALEWVKDKEFIIQGVKTEKSLSDRPWERLEQLILKGLFDEALLLSHNFSPEELAALFFYLTYEKETLCQYAFIWCLIRENEKDFWHYLAFRIVMLRQKIHPAKGVFATALFHIKKAYSLNPQNSLYYDFLKKVEQEASDENVL